MKRSVSRASKVSNDAQDFLENSFPGLPDSKWQDYLEKEENGFFILGIREEILNNCLDICYEKYLSKQAVAFTVHCAYLAWLKVIDMYYMFRDPGDTDDAATKESWEPDEEPKPSDIDSWGSHCIKAIKPEQDKSKHKKGPEKELKEPPKPTQPNLESMESVSFMSKIFDTGEEEYFFSKSFSDTASISSSHKKSIFTRTLSMSRESLPLVEPLTLFQGDCRGFLPVTKNTVHVNEKAILPKKALDSSNQPTKQ